MFNLNRELVDEHWQKSEKGLNLVISAMSKNEEWPLDKKAGGEFEEALLDWLAEQDIESMVELSEEEPDKLVSLFSFMSLERSMYLHSLINEKDDSEVAGELLAYADESILKQDLSDEQRQKFLIFKERFLTLYRMGLVERLFSEERSSKILDAVKKVSEKSGVINA